MNADGSMNPELLKIAVYKHFLENALDALATLNGETFGHAKQIGKLLADCKVGPDAVLRCNAK